MPSQRRLRYLYLFWLYVLWLFSAQLRPAVSAAQEQELSYNPFFRILATETATAFEVGSFDAMKGRFAESFLKQVPLNKLNEIPAGYEPIYGEIIGVDFVGQRDDPNFGAGTLFFHARIESNKRALIRMRLGSDQKIVAWHLGPSSKVLDSTEQIRRQLRELAGDVSVFARLRGQTQPFFALNPDKALAIGSTFKLYVLAELLRQSETGGKGLGQVVRLRKSSSSAPSGKLHKWPQDSPLTVQTLATLMISESDNTATDHLIDVVGREELEGRLGRHYLNSLPELSTPFLKTRELFLLQSEGYEEFQRRYLSGDVQEKRKVLRELGDLTLDGMPSITPVGGVFDRLEWFASTRNLVDLMDFLFSDELFRKEETRETMRNILAINPGIPNSEKDPRIRYLGYKGGSELGVLNLTQLIETIDDQQLVVSMTWNNKEGPVDDMQLIDLFTSLRQVFLNTLESTDGSGQSER